MDDQISNLFAGVYMPLVWNSGGEVDDVSGSDVDGGTVADAGAADFVGGCGLCVDDFAAVDERGFAGFYDHDGGGGLVDLGYAGLVVDRDGEAVIAEVFFVRDAEWGDAVGPDGDWGLGDLCGEED